MEQEADNYLNEFEQGKKITGPNFEKHDDYKYITKLLEEYVLIEDKLEKAKRILKIYEEVKTKKKFLSVDFMMRHTLLVKAEEFKDTLKELLSDDEYNRFLIYVEEIRAVKVFLDNTGFPDLRDR